MRDRVVRALLAHEGLSACLALALIEIGITLIWVGLTFGGKSWR